MFCNKHCVDLPRPGDSTEFVRIVADYVVVNASVLCPCYAGERLVYCNAAYSDMLPGTFFRLLLMNQSI